MGQIYTLWKAVEDKKRDNALLKKAIETEERTLALERALEVQVGPHPAQLYTYHLSRPPSLLAPWSQPSL